MLHENDLELIADYLVNSSDHSSLLDQEEYLVEEFDIPPSLARTIVTKFGEKYRSIPIVSEKDSVEFLLHTIYNKALPKKVLDITLKDDEFKYQLLARMKQDCHYFLGYGDRNVKHLWANSVQEQIMYMKAIWESFEEKPQWLTMEQINELEREMENQN